MARKLEPKTAAYRVLHMELQRKHPKKGVCERCGYIGKTQYAFLHHPKPHTRDRKDYEELCAPCHNADHIARIPEAEKTCETCGEIFATKRKSTRYCSNRCRQKALRLRAREPRRHVTAEPLDPRERYVLYRLCDCSTCEGKGKGPTGALEDDGRFHRDRCPDCRGEGRIRQEVATAGSPEAVGVALVTLAREGEFEECPLGLLDRMPECSKCDGSGQSPFFPLPQHGNVACGLCAGSGVKPTGTWLLKPWLPSARNVTDAARTLAKSKKPAAPPDDPSYITR